MRNNNLLSVVTLETSQVLQEVTRNIKRENELKTRMKRARKTSVNKRGTSSGCKLL